MQHQTALAEDPGVRRAQRFDSDANLYSKVLSPSQKTSKMQKLTSETATSPHRINDSDAQINDVTVRNPKCACRSAVLVSSPDIVAEEHHGITEKGSMHDY